MFVVKLVMSYTKTLRQLRDELEQEEQLFNAAVLPFKKSGVASNETLSILANEMVYTFSNHILLDKKLNEYYVTLPCAGNNMLQDASGKFNVFTGVEFVDLINICPRNSGDHYYPHTLVAEYNKHNFTINFGYMQYDAVRDIMDHASSFKEFEGISWMSKACGVHSSEDASITEKMILFLLGLYQYGAYAQRDMRLRGWAPTGGKNEQKLRRTTYATVY